ncbi:GCN5 family acetyltransferase [Shewanella xiamenensis]|uniref:GNAT family N-acetyltransferase n=1 Tax=Shewanella xiamenensis TaxID=332186 RepID=UPI001187069D|nr:GNAT family N-acetyltransferase [Shewanella xiamenensis]TVL18270.1 GCN5 family acetyltransferase [Shewanella xiamenensis]TVL18608.1 GCN5 family acetyltransferase [Shewanella xiamenensis]TVL25406.1 GCN5 family acetyltransferase [Shewanella xiamenensis]TVL31548.1 GCN5 family acetyltransferase [Shewanella xiamenensis]TVP01082.1 GCN5 family acetyltransferase [Shewanella xiamenensis]
MSIQDSVDWQILKFNQLTANTLYEILKLRVDVFVVEQACAYPELDDKDRHPETQHLIGLSPAGELLTYARILPPGLSYPEASIGRVVVSSAGRGKGLAMPLMQRAIESALSTWPKAGIQIGAQDYLKNFYQKLGFNICSEMYLEDGIPHIDMRYQPK